MLAEKKISLSEYMESDSDESRTVKSWGHNNRYSYYWRSSKVFISDEVVREVDQLRVSPDTKMRLVQTYADGSKFGLTDDGWREWIRRPDHVGGYATETWVLDEITRRTKTKSYQWKWVVERVVSNSKPVVLEQFKNTIRMLFFINSEFDGTFAEYLAIDPIDEELECINESKLPQLPHQVELCDYAGQRNVATFDHRVAKKTRELLLAQDREWWTNLLVNKKHREYTKGNSHEHAEAFIKQIINGKNTRVRTAEELSSLYLNFIAKAFANKVNSVPSKKYHLLVKSVFSTYSLANPFDLKGAIEEYSAIYESIKDLDLTLTQTIGVVQAITEPKYWMRGNKNNAIFLLEKMLTDDESKIGWATILGDSVFNAYDDLPTETEWKKAIEDDMSYAPAEMFMSMVAHPKTERSMKANPSDSVARWRSIIND